ncbi:hypothetical protein AAFG07_20575 [Bradyrhizobium sp. B097]|uniref:hypothetical protein n=1 Tax=Bradyrhizobium sp. B097 TaxID=3140244 RepID=UPI00318438C7
MSVVSAGESSRSSRSFWLGVAAYLAPTFPLGFFWHLAWFEGTYRALAIYRADPIIPLGLASMAVQAMIFSWAYPRLFPADRGSALKAGLLYGLVMGLLSWSFTTLAVAAKHPVASIVDYMVLETGFTFVQFLIVGPLMALAHRN